MSSYENSYHTCNTPTTGAINCHSSYQCEYSNTLQTLSGIPICCTADRACLYAENITVMNASAAATAIRCDGSYSCLRVNSVIYAKTGNIYITGYDAASDSVQQRTTVVGSKLSDVFITSQGGCYKSKLRNGNNLYCHGALSCTYTEIESFNNVFAYAISAASGSNIFNIEGSVYCGYLGCNGANIINIGDTVVGMGKNALYSSRITNVTNVCGICRQHS